RIGNLLHPHVLGALPGECLHGPTVGRAGPGPRAERRAGVVPAGGGSGSRAAGASRDRVTAGPGALPAPVSRRRSRPPVRSGRVTATTEWQRPGPQDAVG